MTSAEDPSLQIESSEDLFLKDKSHFIEVFGNRRAGLNLAIRVAVFKQNSSQRVPAQPLHSLQSASKFVQHNMRETVLHSFRRTQRLRRIDGEAQTQRNKNSNAKRNRSEIVSDLIHEEFIKKRLNNLRLFLLTTNSLPVYRQAANFRQALWLLHLTAGTAIVGLQERLIRRRRIRETMRFPSVIQNLWRAKQAMFAKKRRMRCLAKFFAAVRIFRFLGKLVRRILRRRWSVTVLVSVLKTRKEEYAIKMYIRRFAVRLLKVQRAWRRYVEWKRARAAIMAECVYRHDPCINRILCLQVCNQQYTVIRREIFGKGRRVSRNSRSFWMLTEADSLGILGMCRRNASMVASELALKRQTAK